MRKPYIILPIVIVAALALSAAVSVVLPVNGGTGLNTASSTGTPYVTSGTWAVDTTLPTAAFPALTGDVTNTGGSLATTVVKIENGSIPTTCNLWGSNSSGQPICEYTAVGSITWNSGGTCTFAAASAFIAFGSLTTTSGQTCTLSPTNLVSGGSYTLKIINASSTAATLTLGTSGSCSAWKIGGGGAGAITLSGSSDIDMLAFIFDGTNCIANFRGNFS